MSQHGIVSPLADQDALAAVGPTWANAIKALSAKISFVRGSISADRHGKLNVDLLRRGLKAFAAVNLPVHAVIEGNLVDPSLGLNPNDFLGYQGDFLKNEWIEHQTNATIKLLQQLGPHDAPKNLFWLNEPNSQAALNPLGSGYVIPVLNLGGKADPLKPEAMSPQAYFASLYHAAYWIGKECPWVAGVYPAALSCFVAFHTSMTDDWIGNYWLNGVKYLTDRSLSPPWPWHGMSLNLEGLVDRQYAGYIAQGAADIYTKVWQLQRGDPVGPLICGEWGVPFSTPGKPLNVSAMTVAAQSIDGIANQDSFFAAHISGEYGIWPISFVNGEIMPGPASDWATALPPMLP